METGRFRPKGIIYNIPWLSARRQHVCGVWRNGIICSFNVRYITKKSKRRNPNYLQQLLWDIHAAGLIKAIKCVSWSLKFSLDDARQCSTKASSRVPLIKHNVSAFQGLLYDHRLRDRSEGDFNIAHQDFRIYESDACLHELRIGKSEPHEREFPQ